MRWMACLALALAPTWVVANQASTDTAVPTSQRASAGRVLVLTSTAGAVVQQLKTILPQGGHGNPALPPIEVEVVRVKDVAESRLAVRSRLANGQRYRAIFSASQTFARAAQFETTSIPIVFDGVDDPVARCLVDTLKSPGRNATGYMHFLHADEFKMIELLHDAFPSLRKMRFLVAGDSVPPASCRPEDLVWSPQSLPCTPGLHGVDSYVQRRVRAAALHAYARTLGVELDFLVLCKPSDFPAIAKWSSARGDAGWLVPWQSLFDSNLQTLADRITATRAPAIFARHQFSRAGGLMSLEPILDREPYRASVLALLQVLGGQEPATLPVQSPRGFSIVVNAATARRTGARPSLFVLRRADEILH
jgi:putative tryptophan/tyrosine transport system substrate-binding protein